MHWGMNFYHDYVGSDRRNMLLKYMITLRLMIHCVVGITYGLVYLFAITVMKLRTNTESIGTLSHTSLSNTTHLYSRDLAYVK